MTALVITFGCALVAVAAAVRTVWLLHVGTLDAMALAAKTAAAHPRSARDWPELRLSAVVAAPDPHDEILVVGRWPGRPGTVSTMVLRSEGSREQALVYLGEWCQRDTALSPKPWRHDGILLRPRGATSMLRACIVDEKLTVETLP